MVVVQPVIVASKGLLQSSFSSTHSSVLMVKGSHLGFLEDAGANFAAPARVDLNWSSLKCQGWLCKICQALSLVM